MQIHSIFKEISTCLCNEEDSNCFRSDTYKIAVGVFAFFSFAATAIYMNKYFAKRSIKILQDEVRSLAAIGNLNEANDILKKHPNLMSHLGEALREGMRESIEKIKSIDGSDDIDDWLPRSTHLKEMGVKKIEKLRTIDVYDDAYDVCDFEYKYKPSSVFLIYKEM